jgi:hypothetical protein
MEQNITSYGTPEYTIKVEKQGQGIMTPDSAIESLILTEGVNMIPQIELVITTSFASRIVTLDDLDITIDGEEGYKLTFKFGVYKAKAYGSKLKLAGYMTERKNFKELGSEYLGDGLDDAIKALGIRDKVDGVDSVAGGYWRLNETRVEAFLRLMKGAKENSVWVMGTDELKVLDLSQNTGNGQDYNAPSTIEYLAFNDRFTPGSGEDPIYDLFEPDDDENPMYNATWNAMSIVGFDHKDFTKNYISSLKYKFPAEQLYKFVWSGMYMDYLPGSVVKMDLDDYNTENMLIVSKVTNFSPRGITTVAYLASSDVYQPKLGA